MIRVRINWQSLLLILAVGLPAVAGCHVDMWVQPKVKPQQESDFFSDGQGSRQMIAHTVARGHLREDEAFYTGMLGGKLVEEIPMPITRKDLERGQERFNIFCSPCHSRIGDGNGMIAQRGFALRKKPGNYHSKRLRKMAIGHFYDVITNGHGAMYSYAQRVEPPDRWRIAAYIRVLQRSQDATKADVPEEMVDELNGVAKPELKAGEAAHE